MSCEVLHSPATGRVLHSPASGRVLYGVKVLYSGSFIGERDDYKYNLNQGEYIGIDDFPPISPGYPNLILYPYVHNAPPSYVRKSFVVTPDGETGAWPSAPPGGWQTLYAGLNVQLYEDSGFWKIRFYIKVDSFFSEQDVIFIGGASSGSPVGNYTLESASGLSLRTINLTYTATIDVTPNGVWNPGAIPPGWQYLFERNDVPFFQARVWFESTVTNVRVVGA